MNRLYVLIHTRAKVRLVTQNNEQFWLIQHQLQARTLNSTLWLYMIIRLPGFLLYILSQKTSSLGYVKIVSYL